MLCSSSSLESGAERKVSESLRETQDRALGRTGLRAQKLEVRETERDRQKCPLLEEDRWQGAKEGIFLKVPGKRMAKACDLNMAQTFAPHACWAQAGFCEDPLLECWWGKVGLDHKVQNAHHFALWI